MANRTRRIKESHDDLETRLLQLKFQEVYHREQIKKIEKEVDKVFKKLDKAITRGEF